MNAEPVTAAERLERARALHDAGRHAEAKSTLLDALTVSAGSVALFSLLASIECAQKQPRREARALEQALATLAPGAGADAAQLWTRLAAVRARLGDRRAAAAAHERAIREQPGNQAAHQGLASARLALQDLQGAKSSAADLERLFPDDAFTHLYAGHVHKAHGDTSAAGRSYARALEHNPDLGEALYGLVDLEVPGENSGPGVLAAALCARDDLAITDRVNASFAHARILDRAGHYARAFLHFRLANELARNALADKGTIHSRSAVEARTSRTIEQYPAASFDVALDALPIALNPIFVIGLPRSGTTLIEQILSSHGDVEAGGELPIAHECEREFRQSRRAADREGPVDVADTVDAELLASARERYLDALFERGFDGPWVVDKLPSNFEIAGFLRLMFPSAPLIHCVRDPRATCFSLFCANFAAHEPWYHDLDHIAHFFGQYRRLMAHWSRAVPAPFIEIGYEELVSDPDVQITALLENLGLTFEQACIDFHRNPRPILTASHAQVRRPMYASAIGHWRHYARWLGAVSRLAEDR